MGFLDFLGALVDIHTWLIDGPRALYRLVRRFSHPTPQQIAASKTPEMKRFGRNVWLLALGWLAASLVLGVAAGSLWGGVIVAVIGAVVLPGIVEQRYNRLLEELRPAAT